MAPVPHCNSSITVSVAFGYLNEWKEEMFVIGEACYSEIEGRTLFIHTKHDSKRNNQQIPLRKDTHISYARFPKPNDKYENYFATALHHYRDINPKLFLRKQYFIQPEHFSSVDEHDMVAMDYNFFLTNGVSPDHLSFHFPNYDLLLKDIMSLKKVGTFDLYVGAHSVLSLKNFDSRPVEIYLIPNESKYVVPKYVWIVVKTESRKAAAFLILNDINASEEDVRRAEICESRCTEMRWLRYLMIQNSYNNSRNGYVWCCDLKPFAHIVREMPQLDGKFKFLA